MTLPMGRVSTPRRAIASHTRRPARSRNSKGSRVRQSRTSSTPATQPGLPHVADDREAPERLQFAAQPGFEGAAADGIRPLGQQLEAGEPGGGAELIAREGCCPWKKVLNSSYSPRKASKTAWVMVAIGR